MLGMPASAAAFKATDSASMLQSQSTSNPVAVSQWASVEALNGPQALAEFQRMETAKWQKVIDHLRESYPPADPGETPATAPSRM